MVKLLSFWCVLIPVVSTLMMASCAARSAPALQRATVEATELRAFCKDKGVRGSLVSRADSLHRESVRLVAHGHARKGETIMEMAALCYRLAISHKESADRARQIEDLRRTVSAAREQAAAYEKVINEIEKSP